MLRSENQQLGFAYVGIGKNSFLKTQFIYSLWIIPQCVYKIISLAPQHWVWNCEAIIFHTTFSNSSSHAYSHQLWLH